MEVWRNVGELFKNVSKDCRSVHKAFRNVDQQFKTSIMAVETSDSQEQRFWGPCNGGNALLTPSNAVNILWRSGETLVSSLKTSLNFIIGHITLFSRVREERKRPNHFHKVTDYFFAFCEK